MVSRWAGIDEFVHVVEIGSFTAAAERMGVSKSFVSKQVSMLEDRLEVRLLQRTTRKLTLTEIGEVFYRQCQAMLELYEQTESAIADIQKKPRGTLKLALNSRFGIEYTAGAIAAFCKAYPELSVEVHSSFADTDLVAEGYDLAFRYGKLEDSSLVARSLWSHLFCLVASPEYWEANGQPQSVAELAHHNCLTGPERAWLFNTAEGSTSKVRVSGDYISDDGAALFAAVKAGIGIAQLPEFYVQDAVEQGDLVKLQQPWSHYWREAWAVYPHSRHLSAKVRFFVDFIVNYFGKDFVLRGDFGKSRA